MGVDPILRENIWKYLRGLVVSKKTTVIVTTHYINEAEQSDCVGMLRNGRLLIEDSPSEILRKFQLGGLEDVFAHLCLKGDEVEGVVVDDEAIAGSSRDFPVVIEGKRKSLSQQRLKALIWKEFLVLRRQIL